MKKAYLTLVCLFLILFTTLAFGSSVGDTFKGVATTGMVRTAAGEVARVIKGHHQLKVGANHALNSYAAILMGWATAIEIRWGKDGFEKMTCARARSTCTLPVPEKKQMRQWRDLLFYDAREYLKSPENLWIAYRAHKQDIVDGVVAQQGQVEMREYLTAIAKYFAPAQIANDDMCPYKLTTHKINTSRGKDAPDWYAYEFAERRRKEGGDKLVAMYRQVIIDLAQSL